MNETSISKKHWYVVHTYSGFEKKVKETLENIVESEKLTDVVSQVLIPTEEVAEIKNGKKRISTKKIFPGYIIVEMALNDDIWHIIKEIPGVTGFVGPGRAPVPLSQDEVNNILQHMEDTEEAPRPRISFEAGETVKVIEGPFYNFTGYVSEVNHDRGRLKVMVDILGRSTPVELDFLQVEKIS